MCIESLQSKFVLYVFFFKYRTSNKGIFEQDMDVLRGFYSVNNGIYELFIAQDMAYSCSIL